MEEKNVSYGQIEKANSEIITMPIGNKKYATVNERVKAFRKVYPNGSIETETEEITEGFARMKTTIKDNCGNIIATGRASETNTKAINKNSMLENCETSAVGRALGFAGFGIDNSIASGEDVERNKESLKRYEIFKDMYISESEAISTVKNSINELIRKMGIVKVELEEKIQEKLWTDLASLNLNQYLRLENILRTVNQKNNDWNDLYGANVKYKNLLTPEGQEVVYENSQIKFGKIALNMAGTNESLRNEIIDFYMDANIDLTKE